MSNCKQLKYVLIISIVIISLLLIIALFDYLRVMQFNEKPIFAVLDKNTAKLDGGSGTYNGIGYHIDILDGYFLPDYSYTDLDGNQITYNPDKTVTEADFYIFNIKIKSINSKN